MKKAIILTIIILALLATPILASTLQDVEQVVVAKLEVHQEETKKTVEETYTHCRDDMHAYTEQLAEDYYDDLKGVLWKDRAITFILVFMALFLSKAFFRLWDFKNAQKIKALEELGQKKEKTDEKPNKPQGDFK